MSTPAKPTEMSKRFKLLENLMSQGYTSDKVIGKLDVDTLMKMFPDKMEDFKRGYALSKAARDGKIVEFLACADMVKPSNPVFQSEEV